MEVGVLEMRKLKSVTVGIWQRGQWDVIRFRGDEWELEVQVRNDMVVDSGESVELKLCSLGVKPFKEGGFIVMEVRSLKDIEVPLALLSMSWQVVDVAGNGGLR